MNINDQSLSIAATLKRLNLAPDQISYLPSRKGWLLRYPITAGIELLADTLEKEDDIFVLEAEQYPDGIAVLITIDPTVAYLEDWHNLTRLQQESIRWIATIGGADYGVRVIELVEIGLVTFENGKFQLNAWGQNLLLAADHKGVQ